MKDSPILSTPAELSTGFGASRSMSVDGAETAAVPAAKALVFDACQVGVILRAVLFVEAVTAVAVIFGATGARHWVERVAFLSGATLPATLAWLIVACSLKTVLARLQPRLQHAAGVALGAAAGLYGCGLHALVSTAPEGGAPWIGSAAAGALLSSVLVAALVLRAKGRMPAETAARLTELQARIRPHFLFNTLNSAIALVRADPARAEVILEDLSDLFRQALVARGDSVTLAEEVDLARRYLAIEQVRFGARLRVEWAIDARAGTARVPPLVLQPLVENAVMHGVEPSASGADVRVSTERRGGSVVVKVINTVPAGPGAPGSGVAQANVRDRINLLHDVQGQFRAEFKKGVYQARLEVPA